MFRERLFIAEAIDFRKRFGSFVLAIKRQTELLRDKVAHIHLKFSDTLLIMLPKNQLDELRSSSDLIILEELDIHLRYQKYWWLSILIFPLIMLVASFNILTIVESTVIGAIVLLVLRSISMEEAYDSINWAVIFLIALLSFNVYLYGDDSLGGANQLALLLSAAFATIMGLKSGTS